MKKFLLIVILLGVLIGSFFVMFLQTANKVAVKVDQKTGSIFAVKESIDGLYGRVEGLYDKVQEVVAEGYSEPDEAKTEKKKQP